MEKLRKSGILKIICYILIPILVAILMLSLFHFTYLRRSKKEENAYVQTENFANNYLYFFIRTLYDCQTVRRKDKFIELEDEKGNSYYYSDQRIYYNEGEIGNYIYYIIVEKETQKKFTNIKSNNYEETINSMQKETKNVYWNLINGKIETNLNYINQDNIKYNYNYNYNQVQYYGSEEQKTEWKDYDIYSFYQEDESILSSNFLWNRNICDFMLQHKQLPFYSSIISLMGLVIIAIYLFWAIGHKKGKEGITCNTFDKLPYEIVCMISFGMLTMVLAFMVNFFDIYLQTVVIIADLIAYLIGYTICAIWGITTIKRIKSRTFWKSFATYQIGKWVYQKLKKYSNKKPTSKKVFWYYWGFVMISIGLATFFANGMAFLILLIFWVFVYYKIRQYIRKTRRNKRSIRKNLSRK